ncbi:c-type cytochrome [Peribacillus frigoritolerans]|uniref:c-type cytochrome n=1 Tax=Peribacillus frigoritolerans TaxID=450367 RepID=UPI0022807764|nr:cytochrome c [Peribacillus frigoritolerans]MCY8939424.1 cytochrome c [Peribacillus frigoritolerans]
MKKIWFTSGASIVLAGCLIFLLFFYRGHQPSPSPNSIGGTQDTSAGNPEEIVSNSCISCHGENLQGGAGPALNKIGAKYSQNDIEDIINNGKNGMPAGVISNEEAAIVAEWLSQKK